MNLRISMGKRLRCPQLALLAYWATFILGTLFAASAHAVPPPMPRELPGVSRGEIETCWIAPYTLATSFLVDGKAVTTVRWFDDTGGIVRQLSGRGVDARTDFILEHVSGKSIIHDVNGLWALVVPKKPGGAGRITAVGDTFVHQFHPVEGQIAADVYAAGNLVGSIGPFTQYKVRDVRLADDGSGALLTWKTSTKDQVQVVVFRSDGKVSYQADCGEDVDDPYPVGGGKGILAPNVFWRQKGRQLIS